MRMTRNTTTNGYSLVEVLVSISVLLIAIVGPMTIAAQGIKSSAFALEQNTAFFLAQEGIEIVYTLRDGQALTEYDSIFSGAPSEQSWDWIDDLESAVSSCDVSASSGCSFGIDYSDDNESLANAVTSDTCVGNNESQCLLYKDTTNNNSIYSHNVDADKESPYTRIVTITELSSDAVQVDVEVSWESSVFSNATQRVKASTILYDTTTSIP